MKFFFRVISEGWNKEDIEQHTHQLDKCSECQHALCSCGSCHSQQCQERCSIIDDIGDDYNTALDVSKDFQQLIDNQLEKW